MRKEEATRGLPNKFKRGVAREVDRGVPRALGLSITGI